MWSSQTVPATVRSSATARWKSARRRWSAQIGQQDGVRLQDDLVGIGEAPPVAPGADTLNLSGRLGTP
jgi:hypothetical protein